MSFQSTNPATGEFLAEHPRADAPAIEKALTQARAAFRLWSGMTHAERGKILHAYAALLRRNADDLARLAAREMGKPIAIARGEMEKCAALATHFADEAEVILHPRETLTDTEHVRIRHEPLGTIFSITPWNFPVWQVLRAAIPALAAGNTVINKPAPNVIGCAQEAVRLFIEAGAPEGTLQTLPVTNDGAADIIADDRIAGVTLTGSERAGAAVAAAAGAHLKKVVLELGGSDPFIVLADADIEAAAKIGARARFTNSGQVCIAAKRFIVEESVVDAFEAALVREAETFTMGDPLDEDTRLGPMARDDLRAELDRQVEATITGGARVVRRGGIVEGPGWFYAPTILRDPPRESPAMREETFGPVAAIVGVKNADEAIALANETRFGLSANLWTRDEDRALALADRIESGCVFINSMTASDPRFPFGGIKRSGFGRELGPEGVLEFVNTRTIYVKKG